MSFLKNLFSRDFRYYRERGERLVQAERYAEAREAFLAALERLDAVSEEERDVEREIRARTAFCGNSLASLNLEEAAHALNGGDSRKAEDHLRLAIELAEDVTIREKAENLLHSLAREGEVAPQAQTGESCSGCGTNGCKTDTESDSHEGGLSLGEKFELLIQTLPGNLPERYAGLGEKFATGYVRANDGETAAALEIFEELTDREENDILLYETAVLHHREGDAAASERLLRRAFDLNRVNPLCSLALVQLLTEAARFDEAIPVLQHMIAESILPEQARLFLGDVYQRLGEEEKAIDQYANALSSPLQREAAERLVPLLERRGRTDEAAGLSRRFLKGCC